MNRLPLEVRVRVLAALVEGNSIRGTCRMVGVAKGTVLRLLAEVGDACARYHDENVRGLTCVHVQCDEIWSYCFAKERNIKPYLKTDSTGDVWTWVGIDVRYNRAPVAEHSHLKTSPDLHAEFKQLSEDYAYSLLEFTDLILAYMVADLSRIEAAIAERTKSGTQRADNRRRRGKEPLRLADQSEERESGSN